MALFATIKFLNYRDETKNSYLYIMAKGSIETLVGKMFELLLLFPFNCDNNVTWKDFLSRKKSEYKRLYSIVVM